MNVDVSLIDLIDNFSKDLLRPPKGVKTKVIRNEDRKDLPFTKTIYFESFSYTTFSK